MSAGCCGHQTTFEGLSADYKRRLWLVIAINAAMFFVEMGAGALAGSQALQADALDFLADSATYGISLAVIGASVPVRAWAAFAKGVSLTLMGLWVFGSTAYHVLVLGLPRAEIMGVVGFLALAANVASVLLLMRYKDGDANVRSVWLCSRNDAIGNVAVMLAAIGVWGTVTKWPDLIVAAIMAGLFLWSSSQILRQSWRELQTGQTATAHTALMSHNFKRNAPLPDRGERSAETVVTRPCGLFPCRLRLLRPRRPHRLRPRLHPFHRLRLGRGDEFENGFRKRFAEQIAFLAKPQDLHAVVVDSGDGHLHAAGFEHNNFACLKCHDFLLCPVNGAGSLRVSHDS